MARIDRTWQTQPAHAGSCASRSVDARGGQAAQTTGSQAWDAQEARGGGGGGRGASET